MLPNRVRFNIQKKIIKTQNKQYRIEHRFEVIPKATGKQLENPCNVISKLI